MPGLVFTNQTGARQDLADLIHITDAKSTPVTSMARKGKEPINPVFSWQADSYKDPIFDGVLSNKDVDSFDDPAQNRVLLDGRIQKFRRATQVDDFAQNVTEVAGIGKKKELARAIKMDLEHIKRDIESAVCSDRESQKQDGANPNRMRGLGSWLQSTAQTDLPVPAAQRTPAGSIVTTAVASLTEDGIGDFLQSMYEQVGKPIEYVLVCGPTLKRRFTGFTKTQFANENTAAVIRTFQSEAENKKITNVVDIFEGDCGTLTLMLSLFLAKDDATAAVGLRRGYAIDPTQMELCYNRRPRFMPMDDQGGGPRGFVDAIVGMKVYSPLGFGKIAPSA